MDNLATDPSVTAELREVLSQYDLGVLVDLEKNERGFVNTAYAICTMAAGKRNRYFLRKYKRGIREEELIFEHSLIQHLVAAGSPVAPIHLTQAGQTYLHRFAGPDDSVGAFYTIFDYLRGEDRFSWVDPELSEAVLLSSARVLAQFHIDASSFVPRGRRAEPRILELLSVIAGAWAGWPARSKGTGFDARVAEYLKPVSASIAATLAALRTPEARALPETVIHCDYHPGNLKFTGDTVTGLFDFDWSKVDYRLFDLGLAMWYFCTSWRGAEDGCIRLDAARSFLQGYQDTLGAKPSAMALTPAEARYLPTMINAGNLYVLHWTSVDYFSKDVDPVVYLVYLDHSLNFMRWYGKPENCAALEAMTASLLAP